MFKKDIKGFRSESLKALDVLQLSLDLEDLLDYEPETTHAHQILAHFSKSPDLLYKFLEWLEGQNTPSQNNHFSISFELIQNLPKLNCLDLKNQKINALLQKTELSTLYQKLNFTLLQNLPQWLGFQNLSPERKSRAERTCLNECAKSIEDQLLMACEKAAYKTAISKTDLSGVRPVFCQTCHIGFNHLTKTIKRHIDQNLGHKGISKFIYDLREKFSFFSLLHLDRGLNGSQLFHLNTHIKLCTEICRSFVQTYQKQNQSTTKVYPNKLIPFTFLHELGFALLLTQNSNLEQTIWQRLSQSDEPKHKISFSKFAEIEAQLLEEQQLIELTQHLENLDFKDLQETLLRLDEESPRLDSQLQIRELAKAYLEYYDISLTFSAQKNWIKEIAYLLNQTDPKDWIPIKNRGHLASEFLLTHQKEREMVKGAYNIYANFIKNFHNHLNFSEHSIETLIIFWSKHLCHQLSKRFNFNTAFHHLKLDEHHLKSLQLELSKRLELEPQQLLAISKQCVSTYEEQLAIVIPQTTHASNPEAIFYSHHHIKDNYYQQLSKFFSESRYFKGGLHRFHVWMNHLHHLFHSSLIGRGYDFFGELESELRKFCRVMEVKIKPRLMQKHHNIKSYFSYLFEEFNFGDELYCLQYRHLIADVFILDRKATQVFDRECTIFLELVFNHLLIQYSQEIWELLKTNSEIARKDIATEIQHHLPPDQLNTALLTFKAKLLDELFQSFDKETEQKVIKKVNFGISNSHSEFQLITTKDFSYWEDHKESSSHHEDVDQWMPRLEQIISRQLKQRSLQHNAPYIYSLKDDANIKSHHLCRFVDFNDTEESILWVHVQDVHLQKFKNIMENFHDKGLALDLTRYQISQYQPLCLTLINTFSSEAQHKALSQLTHLRPSLLKKFGGLLKSFQQELRELLPKSPPPVQKQFTQYEHACKKLWHQHKNELQNSLKLSQNTLKSFQSLRTHAEVLKSSLRMKLEDLQETLLNIKESQTYFDISPPQFFFDFGPDQHYFSWTDFQLFKKHLESHSLPTHSKFKNLSDRILQLKQAWFIHHKDWLYEGLYHYLDELSHEQHHQNNVTPPKISFTIFYSQQSLPAPHQSERPSIALEVFSEGPSSKGAHQRVVKSSGAGYDEIFKTYFKEFSAIAHRNVVMAQNKAPFMECFFRLPSDEASIQTIDNGMLKNRFFNRSGLSTIFFFPCKTFESQKTLTHRF